MGLAHAYAAARQGRRVVVFERNGQSSGASIRNFGMIWPIGQPSGRSHELALRSREHWIQILNETRLPSSREGSLHVVYRDDEARVAQEFAELGPRLGYSCAWLTREQVLERTAAVNPNGLLGGLWSDTELTVDPRLTIATLPTYLRDRFGVSMCFGTAVTMIDLPTIRAGTTTWTVDEVVVCAGDDFETLFPEVFASSGLTRVKLQMLRTEPQPTGWRLGPALAAGLTLRFYPTFSICRTLRALQQRIADETPEYDRWGIHGLVSQTADGALTLGDSHEYGLHVDIFNREDVDDLILRYIRGFLLAPALRIAQRWNGVYAKHPDHSYLVLRPAPGVRVVTSPGGAGMTLSFGIAEETLAESRR